MEDQCGIVLRAAGLLCSDRAPSDRATASEQGTIEFAAGPLPAHHCGTRRESIHGGSYAASMLHKVPQQCGRQGPFKIVGLQGQEHCVTRYSGA